ncbi:MAG TPA: ribulose-phosphate 3-epimerase [Chitinivibrionales bacterium]|nr:ribulose-phosphate 3-epimerase [Chitinivibrionales bacterium]
MSGRLSIGVLSADLMSLADDIALLENSGAGMLHFDVMDGHFVPQLTVGPAFVKAVKTKMLKDVHLMVEDPFDSIKQYASAGADIISVHVESCVHVRACLQFIGTLKNINDAQRGIAAGVAVNPGTALCDVKPLLEDADVVTLLGINPGYPGQTLYPDTAARAAKLWELIEESGRDIFLCIDGGVTKENINEVAKMEPDIVVTGSAVFEDRNVAQNIRMMTDAIK